MDDFIKKTMGAKDTIAENTGRFALILTEIIVGSAVGGESVGAEDAGVVGAKNFPKLLNYFKSLFNKNKVFTEEDIALLKQYDDVGGIEGGMKRLNALRDILSKQGYSPKQIVNMLKDMFYQHPPIK